MKKVTRIALYSAGAIGAILAVALLAVNLYVQSRGTQARIERELSERLGTTLEIRRISVTPWWGLKLTGITMPQADETVPGSFLEADAFRLRVRLSSLFSRRLVIKEISLIHPKVVWAQDADGKWRLPASPALAAAPATSAPAEMVPPVSTATVPASVPKSQSPPPEMVSAPAELPAGSFKPEVRRVNLTNGNFHFLDEKRKPVATFEGVRFRSNFRNATVLNGDASIAKTSLRDRFFLENLKSPLSYDPARLDFSAITARVANGELNGSFTMSPNDASSPFSVMVKFHDLDADRIVSDARGPEGMMRGKLEGQLEAAGQIADPNALTGKGEIYLRDGQVRRYSLLVALGQMLQIEELKQLKLDEAHVKYHITPGVVTVDELVFTSPNIRLTATGTVEFSGRMNLGARLALSERIRGRLFSAVRDNFQPTEIEGYSGISFQVSGTVEHPKTNLMDKVVGDELRDLGGVIESLFGRGRSKRKRVREVPAASRPALSPSPDQQPESAPVESPPPAPIVPETTAPPSP
ncbi:MAG: AsmA-like C-terminal region-containing protein [Chthoniobacterales bacterium]